MLYLNDKDQDIFSADERCDSSSPSLAMAYVPMQRFTALYTPEAAITRGTLFRQLDKPFRGRTIGGAGGA